MTQTLKVFLTFLLSSILCSNMALNTGDLAAKQSWTGQLSQIQNQTQQI